MISTGVNAPCRSASTALDTPFMYRDVIEVAEQAGDRLDLIMLPKTGTAGDVYTVDVLLTQIEWAKHRSRRIGLELMIRSALGMRNIDAIAGASARTESLHFGSGDFAASIGARTLSIGGPHPGTACWQTPTRAASEPITGPICGIIH